MRRRRLVAGVSVAAAAAGAAAALWQSHRSPPPPRLESLRFPRPDGGELALSQALGRRLLLNFWATWCPPCVTEMPLLDRFSLEHAAAGWQVVGLAVDQPEPVKDFLRKRPVHFDIGLAGAEGIDLSRQLGNVNGALPFTLIFENDGSILYRKLGAVDPADLQAWSRILG